MLNKKMITKTFVATILSLTMIAPASVFAYENTDSQYSEDVVVSEDVNIEQSENVNFHQVEIRDTNDLAILSDELDRFVQENPNSSEEARPTSYRIYKEWWARETYYKEYRGLFTRIWKVKYC
ncbi:Uncharacterised protein [Streptobacillus moniliformis]|nr:Uncharacterised protein [Streptobacillus moniliformis]